VGFHRFEIGFFDLIDQHRCFPPKDCTFKR
jgi:hypothetical protein